MIPGRRWWLGVALLLSLGVNLGLLAAVSSDWWTAHRDAAASRDAGEGDLEGQRGRAGRVGRAGGQAGAAGPGWVPRHDRITPDLDDDSEGRHPRRPGPPMERMADRLGLEGEQRGRFLELQREFFDHLVESRDRRRELTYDLYRELAAEEPDRARVDALLADLSELHAATERRTADSILATRALLDDEQQRRYLDVLQRLHHHRGDGPPRGRREHRGHRPRQP